MRRNYIFTHTFLHLHAYHNHMTKEDDQWDDDDDEEEEEGGG